MRVIKFRGLCKRTKRFVYGHYLLSCGKNGREYDSIKDTDSNINNGKIDLIPTEVVPGSVGQLTGLKDKDGVEIYEGDILCVEDLSAVVEFFDGSFQFITDKSQGRSPLLQERTKRMVITGNIHENPELLK